MAAGVIIFRFSDGGFISVPGLEDSHTRRLPIKKGLGITQIQNSTHYDLHFAFSKIDVENGGLTIAPGATFNFSAYPVKILYKRGKPI